MIKITKEQAKAYILIKQGLIDKYKFKGKEGVMDFFHQVGCIQFDPIDICGRNADIVLFSRVKNYQKTMLDELLYKEYRLVDQWDKVMSIYPSSDWPYFKRVRENMQRHYQKHIVSEQDSVSKVLAVLENESFVCGKFLKIQQDVDFFTWRNKNLGKVILDYLFFKGDVIVHHREGVKKHFALASKHLNAMHLLAEDPFENDKAFHKFQIRRRIGAVGLLPQGNSDAYLGLSFSAKLRKEYIADMVYDDELISVEIEGIKDVFYMLKEDEKLLSIKTGKKRLEFIAPLDNFIWDRRLVKKIFDFDYKWEIYHVPDQRQFAPYALPILYGVNLIGQIEMIIDRKKQTLKINNIWYKNEIPNINIQTLLKEKIEQFAKFNNCISYDDKHTCISVYH